MWILISLIFVALIFFILGKRWEYSFKRPKLDLTNPPLVSFIIAAYKSDKRIEKTLKSIQNVDYPKKEVIVVNDYFDKTPEICKKYGVKCIQNEKRMGKGPSLNKAVKESKGNILFFVDDDTILTKNCLKKTIPWFKNRRIGIVTPKFTVRNKRKSFITRLASFDTNFISNLYKTHMFLGSLVTTRGCGFAIRRDVFEKIGGFEETLTEDIEIAARVIKSGYIIQYDPQAIVCTEEPETLKDLRKQRVRWGKGAAFSFFHHYRFYIKNAQFLSYFMPYILITFIFIGTLFLKTSTVLMSLLLLYIIYTFSIKHLVLLMNIFLIYILTNIFTNITTASIAHMFILTYPEKRNKIKDMTLLIPYTFFYLPVVMYFYLIGLISAIKDKRKGKTELSLKDWDR